MEIDEIEVLIKVANGDKDAFTFLFKQYQKYVFTIGKKLTHSDELAEDIVQEIFLKMWIDREKLADINNFGAYLNRIVRNHSFNVLRKLATDTKLSQQAQASVLEVVTSEEVDHAEAFKILKVAIDNLSTQQRNVYELCHKQGMKYEDAANHLGISIETVRTHMKQALRKIRSHFKEHNAAYVAFIYAIFKN